MRAGRPGLTRRRATLLAGALLGGCALPPARDATLARAVEAQVRPLVDAQAFSGAVVLLRHGRVQLAQGWGLAERSRGLAFTPQTPCDVASLAKNFTAAGIALLVHEGRLQLRQPVQALVPEYPHAGVTVAHLLTHSNGLAPDYGSFDRHFRPGQVRETRALLRLAALDTPVPRFEPGSRFEYSDLAYDALALVIERVSGQGYAAFVGERFFAPHGLEQAFARPARLADWPVPRTRGYRFVAGRWQDDDQFDDEAFLGASNLQLSALDVARWGDAWARGRVLPPAAERAGAERPWLGGQRSAVDALGWFAPPEGRPAEAGASAARSGHNTGDYNGFRASLHWHRGRREVVAYVSNGGLPQAQGHTLLWNLVDLLAGRAVPPPRPGAG
jgi:CubicO group peptidase (beta-lactamase class C family)